ncbi:MAG: hypothetical protein NC311_06220 [Muribaculaceae bacterium]|nr:hypothetical protein [Muribaculaceae bacterium]
MRGFLKTFFVIYSLFIITPALAVGMGELCDATNKCDANLFCDAATSKCASCSTATDSKYPLSATGATSNGSCYKDCGASTNVTLGTKTATTRYIYFNKPDDCSYKITCLSNAHCNNDPTKQVCDKDATHCECNNHYTQSGNTCTGEVHKITLRKNQTWGDIDKSVWVKYGAGFADSRNSTEWRANPDIVPTLWWHHDFAGYYDQKEGGNRKIASDGKLVSGVRNTDFADIIELWGHWDPKPYTIRYYKDETSTSPVYIDTCEFDSDCTAWKPSETQEKQIVLLGKEFDSQWKYKSGSTIISAGSKITQPTSEDAMKNGIDLIAVYKPCDAGYYCDTSKQKCPAGATSPSGSSTIDKCHISSTTQFEDSKGLFTLPIGNIGAN